MNKIPEIEQKIRDCINHPRKQDQLFRDLTSWHQLCSSLDVVGDTELVMDSYIMDNYPNSDGAKYLIIYGILQCLFLQQDAVKHIAESLNIEYTGDPLLKRIRDIRNKSIGHPTKKRNGNQQTSHFISRISLTKNGFSLISCSSQEDSSHFMDVEVSKMIDNQRKMHTRMLKEILTKLQEEERMHKEQFADEKLTNIFPQTLSYHLEKVFEGIHSSDSQDKVRIAELHINLIKEIVNEFRTALQKRGIYPAYDWIKYGLEEIEYPIQELENYFVMRGDSYLNEKSSPIFGFFLKEKLKTLQEMAKQLDEEYSEIDG